MRTKMAKGAGRKKIEDPKPGAATPAESALADEWKSSGKGRIRPLTVKVGKHGSGTEIRLDHPGGAFVRAALLMRSMGTNREEAARWLLNTLINAAVPGGSQPINE